jgi:hypothetical protein
MKYKRKIFIIGIAAVLVIWIAILVLCILPKGGQIAEKEKDLDRLIRRLKHFNRLPDDQPLETRDRLAIHERNRDRMKDERNRLLREIFKSIDSEGLEKFFGGESGDDHIRFEGRYKDEFKKLRDELINENLIAQDSGEGTAPAVLQDDSKKEKISKGNIPRIMKRFNIQKALISALKKTKARLDPTGGSKGVYQDVSLVSVRIGQDVFKNIPGGMNDALPRAVGEYPRTRKKKESLPRDSYYRTHRVAMAVEMRLADVPVLLENIEMLARRNVENPSPVLFRFHAMRITKKPVKRVEIPGGKRWTVKREGVNRESEPLKRKYVETWEEPETFPVLLERTADFGRFLPNVPEIIIPNTLEMLEEPPVRVRLWYEVLDFEQ